MRQRCIDDIKVKANYSHVDNFYYKTLYKICNAIHDKYSKNYTMKNNLLLRI